jgi:hypothetical protein
MWFGILVGMFVSELTLKSESQLGPIPLIVGGVLILPTVVLALIIRDFSGGKRKGALKD